MPNLSAAGDGFMQEAKKDLRTLEREWLPEMQDGRENRPTHGGGTLIVTDAWENLSRVGAADNHTLQKRAQMPLAGWGIQHSSR